MKWINRRNYIVYIRNSKRFFLQDQKTNEIKELANSNETLLNQLQPLELDVNELNLSPLSLEQEHVELNLVQPTLQQEQSVDQLSLSEQTNLQEVVQTQTEEKTDLELENVVITEQAETLKVEQEQVEEVQQTQTLEEQVQEVEQEPIQPVLKSTKKPVSKNIFGKIDKRKNFNFEEFEKNVKYKEFSDGTRKKIAAEIIDLRLTFTNPSRPDDRALVLRGPSIQFYEGEVHAIIGESGSGKSVITSLLYGLAGKTANIEEGKVLLYNNEVQKFKFKDWERSKYIGRVISAVFQNPMSTLNPTMKIGKQIMEGMLINGIVKNRKEAKQQAVEYLKLTKINNPEEVMELYPHELSGGMIQRVVIASIVSLHPKILVLDEPTTALDPTVQALVLDIIRELQQKFKMCVIFITHDLGVVASIANYISIMYAGQIIEEGTRDEILWNPQHPYTWGLIMSMPDVNKGERLATIRGSVPSRLNDIVGDAFAVRNEYALTRDFTIEPDMYYISDTHRAKTALLDKQAPEYEPPTIIKEKWEAFKAKQNSKQDTHEGS
ncbi:Oligopeptide ABC transporter, ATP-binding protein [Ureaplasma diversum NCTC 246]|uniref:Oligopeptide ABC transporter, ATP-binding protein n=1 Tax=Ureaplasma diversum NCTC 246 TaxID=1188241 RepID=A0A084F1H7_9BACT|nr:ABC transporter ATP-binding protein [Ureaplasma diversum]KEZ24069.1 Oligopeptide ABC transporter, ATP-binding protein [Ureaplasma diversum NCTC 246]